ncbi:MAG: DUF1295 domain-containing protein, partial [Clostridia bacterium]|nr:DUF1295 domain-containing protein [Clostridia bacterium]
KTRVIMDMKTHYKGADMKEKIKGSAADLIIYVFAFAVGLIPFTFIENVFAATAAYTAAATAVIYVFTVVMKDVSVYDPYWSVAPPVLLLSVMIKYGLWNVNSVILFSVVLIWSARLTLNWFITYKGVGREDWRYAQYREKYPPLVFQLISFVGLQFVPTAVVYAGLTPVLLASQRTEFSALSLSGAAVSLCAVWLEFVSDRAIHGFLREHKGENKTCDVSVWKYSRHPNYLGEMSFWCGLYIYFIFLCPEIWYAGLGFLSIIILFLTVSVPMMERHNEERRPDYAEYKARTSAVLILPSKRR